MTKSAARSMTLILATLLIAASGLDGQPRTRFQIQPGSRLWMGGSSNVHEWTVEATGLDGYVEVTLPFQPLLAANGAPVESPSAEIFMPVKGLKSGHWIMDRKMLAALKAPQQPMIRFDLQDGGVTVGQQIDNGRYSLAVRGVLSVAGVAQVIDVEVEVSFLTAGYLRIEGSKALKMSDFGIAPPKALGGLLITGNDIEIGFVIDMAIDPVLAEQLMQNWVAIAAR